MDYEKYMQIAIGQAELALKAGDFPVGCVIVYDGDVVATGVRKNSASGVLNEIDHAEILALKEFANNKKAVNKDQSVLFCTLEPCLMCYAAIMLSGIRRVVYAYEDVMGGGTACDLSTLTPLYSNLKMNITPDVLRKKSLALFVKFFKNPSNKYWKNSLLEKHTLSVSGKNDG